MHNGVHFRRSCTLTASKSTLFSPLSPSHAAQPCAAVPHEAFRKRRACRTRRPHTCMCVRRAPSRANMHAMYRRNAAHGHRNHDRAWEEPSCSSTRPAEIEAWMQKPLRLGTSPFSWTCGRGRFGRRPGGRECSAPPRTTQNVRLPLSSRMPLLPPPRLSTMRAVAHTWHSGNAVHAERGPTCMCVRRAPWCEAVCGATWERVLATPVSRCPLE
jgi:hypothetical protein